MLKFILYKAKENLKAWLYLIIYRKVFIHSCFIYILNINIFLKKYLIQILILPVTNDLIVNIF